MAAIDILVDGASIKGHVLWQQARFESVADGNPGTATVVIDNSDRTYSANDFHAGKTLQLYIDGARAWDGWVFGLRRSWPFEAMDTSSPDNAPRFWTLTGYDRNLLFTKRIMFDVSDPSNNQGFRDFPAKTSDREAIEYALEHYVDLSGDGLDFDIRQVGSPSLWEEFTLGFVSAPMATLFEDCAEMTGAVYWIGPGRTLHYRSDRIVTAPFVLSDTPTGSQVGYRDLSAGLDFMDPATCAMVWGAGKGSKDVVFARHTNQNAREQYGLWQWGDLYVGAWKYETVARRARTYVRGSPTHRRGHDEPVPVVSCTIFEPGLKAGHVVDFRSTLYDYQENLPLRKSAMTFPTPEEVKYELELSPRIDVPWGVSDLWPRNKKKKRGTGDKDEPRDIGGTTRVCYPIDEFGATGWRLFDDFKTKIWTGRADYLDYPHYGRVPEGLEVIGDPDAIPYFSGNGGTSYTQHRWEIWMGDPYDYWYDDYGWDDDEEVPYWYHDAANERYVWAPENDPTLPYDSTASDMWFGSTDRTTMPFPTEPLNSWRMRFSTWRRLCVGGAYNGQYYSSYMTWNVTSDSQSWLFALRGNYGSSTEEWYIGLQDTTSYPRFYVDIEHDVDYYVEVFVNTARTEVKARLYKVDEEPPDWQITKPISSPVAGKTEVMEVQFHGSRACRWTIAELVYGGPYEWDWRTPGPEVTGAPWPGGNTYTGSTLDVDEDGCLYAPSGAGSARIWSNIGWGSIDNANSYGGNLYNSAETSRYGVVPKYGDVPAKLLPISDNGIYTTGYRLLDEAAEQQYWTPTAPYNWVAGQSGMDFDLKFRVFSGDPVGAYFRFRMNVVDRFAYDNQWTPLFELDFDNPNYLHVQLAGYNLPEREYVPEVWRNRLPKAEAGLYPADGLQENSWGSLDWFNMDGGDDPKSAWMAFPPSTSYGSSDWYDFGIRYQGVAYPWEPYTWYIFRLKVKGAFATVKMEELEELPDGSRWDGMCYMKVWKDTEPEPEEWTLERPTWGAMMEEPSVVHQNQDYVELQLGSGVKLSGWYACVDVPADSGGGNVYFLSDDDAKAPLYFTDQPYRSGTLILFYEGTRLREGIDYVEVDPKSGTFRLMSDRDLSGSLQAKYDALDIQGSYTGGDVYRPAPQLQYGWGTRFDGYNCTMACSAMALDRHTLGAYTAFVGYPRNTPPNQRLYQDDQEGGTDLFDAATAWERGWNHTLQFVGSHTWSDFVTKVNQGRGAILQGSYARMSSSKRYSDTFTGGHAIYINEQFSNGSFWGIDPLYRYPVVYTAAELQYYAVGLFSPNLVYAAFTRVTG